MESSPYSSPSRPYAAQEPLSPTGYLPDIPWSHNSLADTPPYPYSPDHTPPRSFPSPKSTLDMPCSPNSPLPSPDYSPTSPPYSPTSPVYSPTSPGHGCCDWKFNSPASPSEDDLQFHPPSPEECCYVCSMISEHCECPRSSEDAANTACASGADALHGECVHE
jgi:DNA-directed RNA polymerase II subunit RPB1